MRHLFMFCAMATNGTLQIDVQVYHICSSNKSKPVNKQVGGSPDTSIEHFYALQDVIA